LLVAIVVVAAFALWPRGSGDQLDARLSDPGAVVTYPSDGLTNDAVAGEPLPDVVLLDVDDNEVATADLLDGPLVLNLWFTTCPPCAEELPAFAEVDAETDDVTFIGVNTIDPVDTMEAFARDRGVTYQLLRDQSADLVDGVGAVAFPVTLFVTSDGTIIDQTGALDADELRTKVAELRAAEAALA
jgi:peroxiredoxin